MIDIKQLANYTIKEDVYGRDIEEFRATITMLHKCFLTSKQFKIKFLLEGLRTIINFDNTFDISNCSFTADDAQPGLEWIYWGFDEELKSKYETQEERFRIGMLVHQLVKHGASRNATYPVVSEWLDISLTKCRNAFLDYQRLYNIEPSLMEHPYWETFLKIYIFKIEKPFPENNLFTTRAFKKLYKKLEIESYNEEVMTTEVIEIIDKLLKH